MRTRQQSRPPAYIKALTGIGGALIYLSQGPLAYAIYQTVENYEKPESGSLPESVYAVNHAITKATSEWLLFGGTALSGFITASSAIAWEYFAPSLPPANQTNITLLTPEESELKTMWESFTPEMRESALALYLQDTPSPAAACIERVIDVINSGKIPGTSTLAEGWLPSFSPSSKEDFVEINSTIEKTKKSLFLAEAEEKIKEAPEFSEYYTNKNTNTIETLKIFLEEIVDKEEIMNKDSTSLNPFQKNMSDERTNELKQFFSHLEQHIETQRSQATEELLKKKLTDSLFNPSIVPKDKALTLINELTEKPELNEDSIRALLPSLGISQSNQDKQLVTELTKLHKHIHAESTFPLFSSSERTMLWKYTLKEALATQPSRTISSLKELAERKNSTFAEQVKKEGEQKEGKQVELQEIEVRG